MASRSHPHIHPSHGGFSSYINIDPLYLGRLVRRFKTGPIRAIMVLSFSQQIQGFDLNRDDNQLRYTPITVSQEELVYHKNINYAVNGQLRRPRLIAPFLRSAV